MNTIAFSWLLALTVFATLTTTSNADVPRPRGVSLAKASLYAPRSDKSWVCLDGTKTIKFVQINDDYCDCDDGSDEPGTSACTHGQFHCANVGHRPLDIPSSRVNDGVCDCCDASDEWSETVQCKNNCDELGRAEQEQRRNEAELHKRGASKRAEMISKGKQMRAEREVRRAELERRLLEQESLKTEKEQLKHNAEAVEAEALELYKEQQKEPEPEVEDGAQAQRIEAEASFVRYDVNKDGFVEVTELQVDMNLDRDRNGVVTVEEAKYFLDERDRIDLDTFLALSWPRIKPLQMLAQGLFKPPVIDEELPQQPQEVDAQPTDEQADMEGTQTGEPEQIHNEDYETGEDEEGYEEDDEEADVGEGSVTEETTPAPEYDPETQHLIDLANEARHAYTQVEQEIREIEHEITEIDDHTAKDYGPHEEFASLDGNCFTFEDREYVYTLCPFDRASQKQRSGAGSETTLGRWDQWGGIGDYKYSSQKYTHGASCWNGPQRSALVQLKCGLEDRITAVSEPNRCEYQFEFETPAACGDVEHEQDQGQHDEL